MSKCLLSLKVLQSNIQMPQIQIYIPLSLVHLIYTAGDNCMFQNACYFLLCSHIYLFSLAIQISDQKLE